MMAALTTPAPDEQERYVACLSDLCSSLETQVGVVQRCVEMNKGLPSHFQQHVESVAAKLLGSIEACKMDLQPSSSTGQQANGTNTGGWFSCLPSQEQEQHSILTGAPLGPTTCLPILPGPHSPARQRCLATTAASAINAANAAAGASSSGGSSGGAKATDSVDSGNTGSPTGRESSQAQARATSMPSEGSGGQRSDTSVRHSRQLDVQAGEEPAAADDVEIRLSDPCRVSNGGTVVKSTTSASMQEKARRMTMTEQQIELDERDLDGEDKTHGKFVDGVMNPNWPGRLAWDIGVILLVVVDAMILPFQMGYQEEEEPTTFDITWLWLTTGFFMMDMLLSFLTAFTATIKEPGVRPGKLVTSKRRIARNYLRTWFPIDFTSTIPWGTLGDLASGGGNANTAQMVKLTKIIKFVRFLRLMRMLRLAKLAMIWEKVEARTGSLILKQSVALLRVVLVLVGICHWNACIWWMIGQPRSLITDLMSEEAQRAWAAKPHWTTQMRGNPGEPQWNYLEGRDRTDQYIFCFYWTLGVMRTMPAEVQPTNKVERLYIMVFMFFAFSMFAICVALITQTFFKFSERKRIFDDDMAQVRMYMRNIKHGGASDKLQSMVKSFLVHLFEQRRIHAKESHLLGYLPTTLQNQIKFERIELYLQKLPLVATLPDKAAIYVSNISEIIDVPAGGCVSRRERKAEAVWILMSGRLSMSRQDAESANTQDTSVDIVDPHCLVVAEAISNLTVHAVTCSVCIKIDKTKFLEMMTTHEDFLTSLQEHFNEDDDDGVINIGAWGQCPPSNPELASTAAVAAIIAG